jgi:hypothetical protein
MKRIESQHGLSPVYKPAGFSSIESKLCWCLLPSEVLFLILPERMPHSVPASEFSYIYIQLWLFAYAVPGT